ncbi:hypothetical protein ACSSS7_003782 [Eimeria intestinalis]
MEPSLKTAEEGHRTEKWGLIKKLDLAKARDGDGRTPGSKKSSAFRLRASAARTQAECLSSDFRPRLGGPSRPDFSRAFARYWLCWLGCGFYLPRDIYFLLAIRSSQGSQWHRIGQAVSWGHWLADLLQAFRLLKGVCGYIPLHAFQFYTLFFQYVGMPDWQASLLTACPLVGGLLGSLFGGWLGDQAERWNAFHGRPLVGQLGTLLALPLIYIGLLGIPRRPEFFGFYAIDMLFLGFAISWCPSGVNRPILSEIVEPDARATVFATQIAFEGSISAMLGSPVIALLAESIFGYRTGALPSHSAADHERNTEVRRKLNTTVEEKRKIEE